MRLPQMLDKRIAALEEKEKAGMLTDQEKAQLQSLRQRRAHHMKLGEARWARIAELQAKKSSGTLSDGEKAELEKIEKIRQRHAALSQKHAERLKDWAERKRAAKRKAVAAVPGIANNAAVRAEFAKHGRRMARLERAREVAEAEGREDFVARVDKLIEKEKARHDRWIAKHKAQSSQKGAAE
jgi:uncharacterized protein YnzC (UPF0291/DUF896 family)